MVIFYFPRSFYIFELEFQQKSFLPPPWIIYLYQEGAWILILSYCLYSNSITSFHAQIVPDLAIGANLSWLLCSAYTYSTFLLLLLAMSIQPKLNRKETLAIFKSRDILENNCPVLVNSTKVVKDKERLRTRALRKCAFRTSPVTLGWILDQENGDNQRDNRHNVTQACILPGIIV